MMTQIELKGSHIVLLVDKQKMNECKACGELIFWGTTKNGKKMPIEIDEDGEYVSHFANCPNANYFRKI